VSVSEGGRWLIVHVHKSWGESQAYLADAWDAPLHFSRLTPDLPHSYEVTAHDAALYVLTNEGAPRFALYAVDPEHPERDAWRLVIPEHATDVLSSVTFCQTSSLPATFTAPPRACSGSRSTAAISGASVCRASARAMGFPRCPTATRFFWFRIVRHAARRISPGDRRRLARALAKRGRRFRLVALHGHGTLGDIEGRHAHPVSNRAPS